MGEAIHSRRTMITTRKGVKRKARETEEAEAKLMRRDREAASPPRKRVREAERQGGRDRQATPPRRGEREATPPKRSEDRESSPTRRSTDVDDTLPRQCRDRNATPLRRRDRETTPPPRKRVKVVEERQRHRDREAAPPRRREREAIPPKRREREATPPKCREREATPPKRSLPRRIRDTYGTSSRSRDREATPPMQKRVKEAEERRDRNGTPPRRRERKDTPPRRSKDREATPPRRCKDIEATPPRCSRDRDATPSLQKRVKEAEERQRCRDREATPPNCRGREATPPRRRESKATSPRRSKDREATPSRPNKDKDTTPPRHSRDRDATPLRRSTEREATSPGHSREKEDTMPRRSRDRVATPPGHRYRQATPPLHRDSLPLGRVEHNSKSENTMETWKLKDLWKSAIPAGAGLYKMDSLQEEFQWDFSNLEQEFEENGKLYHEIVGNKNKVYLFGIVERHAWIQDKVIVPVVVAVASPSPPSDEVTVKPLELDGEGGGEETRIPMRQLKMDWIPCITPELERFERSPCVLVLGSTSSTTLENSKNEDHTAKFQSFVPCLDHQTTEEEHYQCRVQCEMDELAKNIISETIEIDEELPPVLKAGLKEYVADKLFLAKRKHRQSYREKISNTQKEGTCPTKDSENMRKLYKFYPVPTPETPDISKTKYPFHGYYCEQEAESKISLCDLAASIC